MSRYNLEPRPQKVHLFHDQQGATYAGGKLFCDTLCKGNWNIQTTLTTTDPEAVTCKICMRDARFQAVLASQAVDELLDELDAGAKGPREVERPLPDDLVELSPAEVEAIAKRINASSRFGKFTPADKAAYEAAAGFFVQQCGRGQRPSAPLRTRHRIGWRGKLILQVCENYPINVHGERADHWRDAKLSDLDIGVV